jgi:hypothetical protein
MNVAIDLDNVMVDLRVVEDVSKELGYTYTTEDVISWGYSEFPNNFRKRVYEKFSDPNYMCNLKPFNWTKKKLDIFKLENHRIFCSTSRCNDVKNETIKMVNELFPQIDKVLYSTGSKIEALIKNKADVLIDDNANYIKDALMNNIKGYLVSNDRTKYNWWLKKYWDIPIAQYLNNLIIVKSLDEVYL